MTNHMSTVLQKQNKQKIFTSKQIKTNKQANKLKQSSKQTNKHTPTRTQTMFQPQTKANKQNATFSSVFVRLSKSLVGHK